jgi:superfamily II DNA or RNA helicase
MSEDDGFQALELPPIIDTSTTNFVEDFYQPLLSNATQYKRGVGYFTSSWLREVSQGMTDFVENGGHARIIASPILNTEDWEAIKTGQQARRQEILREQLQTTVDDLRTELEEETRNALAWLIADGVLDFQLAIPSEALDGEFHDKFGIFIDESGNKVAFHGSQNDSAKGQRNYESYDVFCNWVDEREARRVTTHEERFDTIWKGNQPNLSVYSLPESVRESIAQLRNKDNRPYNLPDGYHGHEITLRDYQKEAVDAWFANDKRGLLQMATGTGKTYTALGALDRALEDETKSSLVVIAVPVTHLAAQWADNLAEWGFDSPRYIYGSANSNWKAELSSLVDDLNIGISDDQVVLTTHKTLSSDFFREQIEKAQCPLYLIADEVHRLGSEEYQKGLLETYEDRLGLSATPERHYDEEGTTSLLTYFDDIVFEFGLSEAIPEYLTPYRYYPHIVEMTVDELEEYRQLSHKMAKAMRASDEETEVPERLAIKRARIVKGAENKYEKLESVLDDIGEPDHLLVYTNSKQMAEVQQILDAHGIIQHKFTYKEDDEERERLLAEFDRGDYDALVAIRCLDEGVDVPATRQAILMSNSGNPMQFIQRRGRVLRHAPGKKQAEIYDLIVVPTLDPSRELISSEQGILEKELRRFEEFASNAKNEAQARNIIQKIRLAYEL